MQYPLAATNASCSWSAHVARSTQAKGPKHVRRFGDIFGAHHDAVALLP